MFKFNLVFKCFEYISSEGYNKTVIDWDSDDI